MNTKKQVEDAFELYKKTTLAEFKLSEEQKADFEKSLKNAKTNEAFMNSEIEHLRNNMESSEKKLAENEKEINFLKEQLKESENENPY